MIASLPMYDFPEAADANDRLWNSIRAELAREGIEAPAKLEREAGRHEVWRNEKLLLSQTCGLPFRKELHNSLTLVGTPDCELEACEPGYYRSVFVASNACAEVLLQGLRRRAACLQRRRFTVRLGRSDAGSGGQCDRLLRVAGDRQPRSVGICGFPRQCGDCGDRRVILETLLDAETVGEGSENCRFLEADARPALRHQFSGHRGRSVPCRSRRGELDQRP